MAGSTETSYPRQGFLVGEMGRWGRFDAFLGLEPALIFLRDLQEIFRVLGWSLVGSMLVQLRGQPKHQRLVRQARRHEVTLLCGIWVDGGVGRRVFHCTVPCTALFIVCSGC